MAQSVKPMRPDIPTPTNRSWSCAICNGEVSSEEQEVHERNAFGEIVTRIVYIPASRYWNGYGIEVFCTVECGIIFHNNGNQNQHLI